MAFDWLGAVGAGVGVGNFISGAINTNKAIKAQKEENEKNRQYNWRVMQTGRQVSNPIFISNKVVCSCGVE